jgi:hypothetical protein
MCLLAALGHEPSESDNDEARAYAGALLLLEGLNELRNIRRSLSPKQ